MVVRSRIISFHGTSPNLTRIAFVGSSSYGPRTGSLSIQQAVFPVPWSICGSVSRRRQWLWLALGGCESWRRWWSLTRRVSSHRAGLGRPLLAGRAMSGTSLVRHSIVSATVQDSTVELQAGKVGGRPSRSCHLTRCPGMSIGSGHEIWLRRRFLVPAFSEWWEELSLRCDKVCL